MIVNVSATHTAIVTSQLSRHDLLSWVNATLKADFTKVDELCTGAAYCQMMHSLYPKMVPIKRVKFCTNLEHEFIDNFKILQTVFQKMHVQKAIPIDRLVRGKFQDNIEFLQWFKKFYDANNENKSYDPVGVRSGQPMAFGSASMKKKTKFLSPRAGIESQQHSYREESSLKNIESHEAHVLKRSLTRTELRHDLSLATDFIEMSANNEYIPKEFDDDEVLHDDEMRSTENQIPQLSEDAELEQTETKMPEYLAHAGLKLERILTYCLESKAAGKATVDISKVKHIIYAQPHSAMDNEFVENAAQLGAGDHVEINDVVEEN